MRSSEVTIIAGLIAFVLSSGCAPSHNVPTTAEALARADCLTQGTTLYSIRTTMDIVADNIANADTTGFKRRIARTGSDGRPQITFDMAQGSPESTGRQLDVSISGKGFFRVSIKSGDERQFAYTRNGNLFVNAQNELVLGLGDGMRLEPPIVIPPNTNEISISQSGEMTVLRSGQVQRETVGQIRLWCFVSPEQLARQSDGLFRENAMAGQATESKPGDNGAGVLLQGFLENSNVDPAIEQRRLEFLQRWYEAIRHAK